ncbi:hypothetical protein R1sor_023396 [Riccia sorocarpa]|uniref:Reverse transcriptase domain-containing protein n=1 Tax=Riccia sorocarpa TaxID=122646 RepID=A0ABD3GQV6_9MARC
MSRLDRAYLTCSGDWLNVVSSIKHDAKAGISDHAPVIIELELQEDRTRPRIHKSYMKLAVDELRSEPKLELENSPANRNGYRISAELLKEKDVQEATLWRSRSRAKWLHAGDAPTKYFFTLWQAKVKQEEIRVLKLDDGTLIEDRGKILEEVGRFYKQLYTEDGETDQANEERRVILQGINKKVTPAENRKLEQLLLEDELEECIKNLARDKAPGLDGVSADVLREVWSEVKPLCMQVLSEFWEDEQMTSATKKGVTKLIPKNEEKSMLTNRHPITLLGITYKIISRILADRIKPLLPGLVNGQQTGFVPGRSIFDNILTLKQGEDWAVETGQEAVFLKLDFIKAYDRVRHIFLWETLEAMGFGAKFIRLIHGLMIGAEATVHQNGEFTECFEMEGGCGRATESNFYAARRVVERFENISGASLNVAKSLVVLIGLDQVPGWLFNTGCRVAANGEV